MHREGGVCSSGLNLSVIAARCHLPYRGEALAFREASPLRQRLPYQGQRRRPPPVAETGSRCWGSGQQDASDSAADAGSRNQALSAKQTERLYKGQPANYTKAPPGFFPRTLAFYYTTKHHSGVVMSRFQYPRPAGRHDFSAYLAEKEAKTHSVRSWPLSCFLYRPNKSACVPVLTKYSSVSVCR